MGDKYPLRTMTKNSVIKKWKWILGQKIWENYGAEIKGHVKNGLCSLRCVYVCICVLGVGSIVQHTDLKLDLTTVLTYPKIPLEIYMNLSELIRFVRLSKFETLRLFDVFRRNKVEWIRLIWHKFLCDIRILPLI